METKSFLYCFVLGTNHSICKAEIITLLGSKRIPFKIKAASQETLIVETQEKIESRISIDSFGGVAKLIKIFGILPSEDFLDNLNKLIKKKEFKDFFLDSQKKRVVFGISLYHSGTTFKLLNRVFSLLPRVCEEIKYQAKSWGKRAWFLLPPSGRVLSTVFVDKNILSRGGVEFIICVTPHLLYLGKTLAVQDYKSYSLRDYGRPKRDPRVGMTPPKIAKIMINLAQKNKDSVFLDPFCGSGTFLQELILLGYQKIIGADISTKAISNTKTNLEWLFEKYHLKKEDYHIKLITCDAQEISSRIPPKSIEAIVTEPYLGSTRLKFASSKKIRQEIKKLEVLYCRVFEEFKKILTPNGVIVIIFPVFRFKNQLLHLEILNKLKGLGFKRKSFLSSELEGSGVLGMKITPRGSIIYYRPGQTVSREIILFTNS